MNNYFLHGLALVSLLFIVACTPPDDHPQAVVADAVAPSRLFLQQVGSHSAIIKWRGDTELACWSPKADGLKQALCKPANLTEGNHQEVLIEDLAADTDYLYSVGGYANDSLRFRTAPLKGQLPADGSVHIWIVGDSGTESADVSLGHSNKGQAAKTLAGYLHYREQNNSKPTDIMLMLGDNAYIEGTDEQWQIAVFDVFGEILSQAGLYSTIGNHEMGAGVIKAAYLREKYPSLVGQQEGDLWLGGVSTSSDPNAYVTAEDRTPRRVPYLDILTLPNNGELGGVASSTEQYYSFDYGNVHVVSLDSQLSARDEQQRLVMRKWLVSDLLNNDLDWTIIIFHHPVYTKGSHDSDTVAASRMGIDQPIIDLRQEFTPIFENYGVDLVFSGHSHSYERSWYLHGHRGDTASFDASQHAELNAKGEPANGFGDEAYQQISISSQKDDKVVYTVAGSSGHVSMADGKLDHPAHAIQKNDPQRRHGLAEQGSVVVDASKNELVARFINEKGDVLDTVVIARD
jgi:acid phosphatase type 7